jgi:DNA-binding transcriptional ArsR family regulator
MYIHVKRYIRSVATHAFEILADPTRRRLVEALRQGERSVGELVGQVKIHQPGVSRHLRILEEAGFVRVRADGQRRLYSLRSEPFDELQTWVEEYRRDLAARLDRFAAEIASQSGRRNSRADARTASEPAARKPARRRTRNPGRHNTEV